MPNTFDYSVTEFYKKLLPEVAEVAYNQMEILDGRIEEKDIENITQRICEDRDEDNLDFWLELSEVEALGDDDDWSDANDCIKNMIQKYLKEKQQVQQ